MEKVVAKTRTRWENPSNVKHGAFGRVFAYACCCCYCILLTTHFILIKINSTASFSRRHDLSRHTRIHDGLRPYVCPTCQRGFSRQDALARHHANSRGACSKRERGKNVPPPPQPQPQTSSSSL
ncbi:hypothetical protein BC832DRAFT_534063 [Gaertneriomyces semiglobifer]|nr:hypothetical protein BC832DRAFT_534063 [Gaertneriomyces semiglobifer]